MDLDQRMKPKFKVGDVIYDDIGKDKIIKIDDFKEVYYIEAIGCRKYNSDMYLSFESIHNNFKLDEQYMKQKQWEDEIKDIIESN